MASIFTRIVQGEIPCYKIAETDKFLAFLDVRPLAPGHTLVIPKQEIDYIFDLPPDLYTELQLFARTVAQALRRAVPCIRIGTAVIGLEVPHCHIHLVPLNRMADINFQKAPVEMTPEAFSELAARIAAEMEK